MFLAFSNWFSCLVGLFSFYWYIHSVIFIPGNFLLLFLCLLSMDILWMYFRDYEKCYVCVFCVTLQYGTLLWMKDKKTVTFILCEKLLKLLLKHCLFRNTIVSWFVPHNLNFKLHRVAVHLLLVTQLCFVHKFFLSATCHAWLIKSNCHNHMHERLTNLPFSYNWNMILYRRALWKIMRENESAFSHSLQIFTIHRSQVTNLIIFSCLLPIYIHHIR